MDHLEYIQSMLKRGKWYFTSEEMTSEFGYYPKNKLSLLRKKQRIITPARGFHVITPEEYIDSGRLPVDRYIDYLMKFYDRPYYVGLLTAASYWGASPQSPQIFQVITNYNRRDIKVNKNKIVFYKRKNIDIQSVEFRKSATGYFKISSPESTLLDLIIFYKMVGGLEYIGSLLGDLSEKMNVNSLIKVVNQYPLPVIQRAAYLLELNKLNSYCNKLDKYLYKKELRYTFLNPSVNKKKENKNLRWMLYVNESLDVEN